MADKLEMEEGGTEEKAQCVAIGPVELETPVGEILFVDAAFVSNGTVDLDDGSHKVTIMLVLTRSGGKPADLGGIAQFTSDEARSFAANMCLSADKADERNGHKRKTN